jgi:D-cysteine desulfhydrase
VKRDDLIDFAFGGNKVRMAEYIGAVAQERQCTKIITFGSVHSNHVRVMGCLCNYLGIDCDLIILRDSEEATIGGNYKLLQQLQGVHIEYCNTDEAHDFIDSYQAKQESGGINYLWVPGGGHMVEAAYGYRDAANEILRQQKTLGVQFDAVFLPCGTGTTQAGLIMGLKDTDIDVIGLTVARPVERCKTVITNLLQKTISTPEERKVNVLESKIPYGQTSVTVVDATKAIAQRDGLFLDPVYNAKSFWGMTEYLKENHFKNVLYLNTGGTPNIF